MRSKEALENIKREAGTPYFSTLYDIDDWREDFKIIEKDLEILNIIKRSIFNKEIHKYTLDEKLKGQKFMTIGLTIRGEDDINKINEWLENGK